MIKSPFARLRIVTPSVLPAGTEYTDFAAFETADLRIEHRSLLHGPTSVESEQDAIEATPGTVSLICEAQQQGADAVLIDCVCDPGLMEGRRRVSIPVIGAGQSTFFLAAMLSDRFSVLVESDDLVRPTWSDLERYGVAERAASVRSIDMRVEDLRRDVAEARQRLGRAALNAVEEDGATLIVLGCTGMTGAPDAIKAFLAACGIENVSVLDPLPVSIAMARALIGLGLSHAGEGVSPPTIPSPSTQGASNE